MLKLIALLQILVLVAAVLPAFGSDAATAAVKKGQSVTAQDHQNQEQGKDQCPCCPDDGQSDGGACSGCSQCAVFTTSPSVQTIKYLPSVSPLAAYERRTKLLQVHLPIFVPPQNLA